MRSSFDSFDFAADGKARQDCIHDYWKTVQYALSLTLRVSRCVKGEQPKDIIILHYHVICKRWSVAFGSSIRQFRFSPSYMYLSSVKYFLYDDTSHGYANWRCHVYIILERASVGGRKVYWSAGFRSAFLFDGQFVVVQQTFGGVKGKLMYAQITIAIPFIVYKSNIVFSVLG